MKEMFNKIKNYLFLLAILASSFITTKVGADSGFDSSYDSGGSWDSGSSFDSYDGGSSGDGEGDIRFFLCFVYIIASIMGYEWVKGKLLNGIKGGIIEKIFSVIYTGIAIGGIYLLFGEDVFLGYYIIGAPIVYLIIGVNNYSKPGTDEISLKFTLLYWTAYIGLSYLIYGETFAIIAAIVLGVIGSIFAISFAISNHNKKKLEQQAIKDETVSIDNIYKELGSDFNIDEFKKEVFENYRDIQIAWMERDLEPVRHLLSDDMFNMYKTQVATLIAKNQKNMMEDIEYENCRINKIVKRHQKDEITVTLAVTCRDYIINAKTGKVVRGVQTAINHYTYELKFVRSQKGSLITICPNCGAALENTNSDKCEYCETVIVKDTDNYVMTDKKMIRQYIKEHRNYEK